jgi:hypothetical protein
MKSKFFKFFKEMIPVTVGVLLAFFISNWSENRKHKKTLGIFKKNVKIEIESNKDKISKIINYHKMLRDSSKFYNKHLDSILSLGKSPSFFRGLRTPILTKSAFSSGIQIGVLTKLNIDLIQGLNELYTSQKGFNEYSKFSLEGFINVEYSPTKLGYQKMLNYLSTITTDMFYMEKDLLVEYDNILKKFKTK